MDCTFHGVLIAKLDGRNTTLQRLKKAYQGRFAHPKLLIGCHVRQRLLDTGSEAIP